ncbi:CBL-interacting serine/threonine-protein kinase 24 isoform X3 [Cryptomeria japonica]|uniref:CBL-interacting serine/threonine-protein kinase 24 isoform X3 n=1 Tax=Cryptomeria japonica TaxID=3369 RepID=UPI0025ACD538|nr:CBL-interacting serine/threonine-protein kinase 24 isoform X3 [Cryptomeria japonica]
MKKSRKVVTRRVGKYEMGRTIGEGNFAKVKFAQNTETGENVAMKVLEKGTILRNRMVDQIKREISIMKLVRHPNIVRLNEVLASQSKIYIVLEFVTGGELFDKIAHQGRLGENESRRYFQQLIDALDYCHSKGVYHRDLKPENLLLDSQGNLKISDFGLSALSQQEDGLLHTTCGTPNYVAPEVLGHKGYDGAASDVWSCGVILYVLMAGYLPFDESDLVSLYRRERYVSEQREEKETGPLMMNAFELITLSQGLNLSALFDRRQGYVKRQTRFISRKPAKVIISTMDAAARLMGFRVQTRNYKMRLEGLTTNKTGQLVVALEVFEVAPSIFMIEVRKAVGETLEYHKFYKTFRGRLEDILWKPIHEADKSQLKRTESR